MLASPVALTHPKKDISAEKKRSGDGRRSGRKNLLSAGNTYLCAVQGLRVARLGRVGYFGPPATCAGLPFWAFGGPECGEWEAD